MSARALVRVVVFLAFALAFVPVPARADDGDAQCRRPRGPRPRDPLPGLVQRLDRYFQRHEVDGVTRDWRAIYNETEEIRQSVVCQLLGYEELQRRHPQGRIRRDIVEHADFLLARLGEVRSHTPFDGMLAYALLQAYELTGETRFLQAGTTVNAEMLAIPTWQCVLNGGLMVALGTGEYAKLTGDAESAQKTTDILTQLTPYQNADGSFPHWCAGSRDIHYTGWMGMELIHLDRLTGDARIAGWLSSMSAFLEGRIAADGRAIYEEPCPGVPGCTNYYYSRASGCWYDYDTRGWTVEPGYCALVFDHQRSPKYGTVMRFLLSLETGGTFPDLYGYWPPPDDPEYPWTIADTSVVNMSVIFWAMTTALADRASRGPTEWPALEETIPADAPPPAPAPPPAALALTAGPNPTRGACVMRLALPHAGDVSLTVHDAAGRRVRTLPVGWSAAGTRTLLWDGRDDRGEAVPAGVYFTRLHAAGESVVARVAMIR